MTDVLSLRDHQAHLHSLVASSDQILFKSLRHSQLEGAFQNRIFLVYRCTVDKTPRILGRIRVTAFEANDEFGCEVNLRDVETGADLWVGHTPERLFGYDLFMQVPPEVKVQWKAKPNGENLKHTLVYGLILRMASRPDNPVVGATYCATPKRFKEMYPDATVDL